MRTEKNSMRNIHNFRDIGGCINIDGRKFRRGLIYRSAKLDNARKIDIAILKSLRIKTNIDLYPQSIKRRNPGNFIEEKKINIPVFIDEASKELLRPLLKKRNAQQEITDSIDSFYREMVEWMQVPIMEIFRILLKKDSYPVLLTCNMGKDRTGFIIAIIQWAVGIDKDTIIREYLKTNDAYIPKARRVIRIMKFVSLGYFPAENYLTAFSIKEKYLQTIISKINEHYGGIMKYLEKCDVMKDDITTLKNILLIP
jgi:protein tyrosine/serine phosphatase